MSELTGIEKFEKWFDGLSAEEKRLKYKQLDEQIAQVNAKKNVELTKDESSFPRFVHELKELNSLFRKNAESLFIDGDFAYRIFLPFKPQVMIQADNYTEEFVRNEIEHIKNSLIERNKIDAYVQEETKDGIYISMKPSKDFIEDTKDYVNETEYYDFINHWKNIAEKYRTDITYNEIAQFIDEESYALHKIEMACNNLHTLLAIYSSNESLVKLQGEFNVSSKGFNKNLHLNKWVPQTQYISINPSDN